MDIFKNAHKFKVPKSHVSCALKGQRTLYRNGGNAPPLSLTQSASNLNYNSTTSTNFNIYNIVPPCTIAKFKTSYMQSEDLRKKFHIMEMSHL